MVRITNGFIDVEVTKGAYESLFKGMGYTIVDNQEASGELSDDTAVSVTADEKFALELIEKPIGEWNKTEVKKFAEIKNIDISGTKSVGEAKEIIKSFLNA